MFIFHWFNIFSSDYWNGFFDGFSFMILMEIIKFAFRWSAFFDCIRDAIFYRSADCRLAVYKHDYEKAADVLTQLAESTPDIQWLPPACREEFGCLCMAVGNAIRKGDRESAISAIGDIQHFARFRDFHKWRQLFRSPISAARTMFKFLR